MASKDTTDVKPGNHNRRKGTLLAIAIGIGIFAMLTVAGLTSRASAAPAAKPLGGCTPTWQQVTSQDFGSYINSLEGVAAVSANDVWLVGYQSSTAYNTLIEHWNGTAISTVPSPNAAGDSALVGADGVSANDVWAVGGSSNNNINSTLIEHWNGSAWSIVSSPNPTTNSYLLAVSALASNDVWAVGNTYNQAGVGSTLIEHWNGSAWSVVASPNPGAASNILRGVTATGANDAWAVGITSSDGTTNHTLTMHWNGSTWATVESPNYGSSHNYLSGVSASGPNDVWAVGYYLTGGINSDGLALHWDGSAWTQGLIGNPTSASILSGVAVNASNDVWIVGSAVDLFTYHTYTQIQHFDGVSWGYFAGPNPGATNNKLIGVAAFDSNNAWAVGNYSVGSVSHTLAARYGSSCPPPTATPAPPTPTPTPCTGFSDVPAGSTFYPYVTCLVNHSIVSGYPDCTFHVSSNVTRGQLSKIVSLAANFTDPPGNQIFQDVAPGSTFYDFVQRLATRSIIGGYACGGSGEPCVSPANRPYFRPNANATRGQIAKIVSNAAGFSDAAGSQIFQDIVPGSTFYDFVQRLANRSIIGGYTCGGSGEPCVSPANRPYFRPNANATRGQVSKIVANTFFSDCTTIKATR